MAKLYQSEFAQVKERRSGSDLNLLLSLLESGSIEVAEDPSSEEIEAARAKLAAGDEKPAAKKRTTARKK